MRGHTLKLRDLYSGNVVRHDSWGHVAPVGLEAFETLKDGLSVATLPRPLAGQ